MDIDYLLTSTRAVRKSLDLDAPVDPNDLRDCLRIAFQAANGSNRQSWRWLVIRDPGLRSEIGRYYREAYMSMTGKKEIGGGSPPSQTPEGRLLASAEWLVEHLAEAPVHVIPCYEPYLPRFADDEAFQKATLYGSIFPAVWNFQLALHSRGYGSCVTTMHLMRERQVRALLDIPETYAQGCLLPVGRLPKGRTFKPAPRRPVEEVVAVDGWHGPSL
jgi:nitroreductase